MHRHFAKMADNLARPIVPVVLPGWRTEDLGEQDSPFRRIRTVEFRSDDDAAALDELALRIVEAAYEQGVIGRSLRTGEASSGGRLVVYVPARSQTVATWLSLRERLEKEPALQGCLWYGHSFSANAWSRDAMEDLALDLESKIAARVLTADRVNSAGPIRHVTLMGHSFGGMLARIAYLMSAGQYVKIKRDGSDWWRRVDRIVLFAAPNRGIEAKRYPWRERAALYWPFGELGRLARDQLVGSEAITNLRIQWIRFFAELEAGERPTVVQFLGKGDRLVQREDSLDIEQFPEAWQADVPDATHADVHIVPAGDDARYYTLRQGILEAKPGGPSGRERRERKGTPVVLVLHGIRTSNETWAEQLCDLIQDRAPNALAIPPTYRYFPMLDFAVPWLRARKIRWLQDQYSSLLARYPRARFCFVGHSNGTYLLGHSLARVPGMAFDRVTLVASVLPRAYDWDERIKFDQVRQVTNHRASRDVPVAVFCNLLRALGMRDVGTAGFDGFDQRREEIEEVYYYNGGHSEALRKENLRHLVEWTLSGESEFPLARKEVEPGKLVSRLSGSTIVGLGVAGMLLGALGLATWLLFQLLVGFLPWPPTWLAVLAGAAVLVVFYLFSRYF